MGTESAIPPVDRRLAELAAQQYGVVTRGQLSELGLSAHGIAERVRAGRLHRLHRGVYAVGHSRLRREGHWLAAVLSCGPGAVLSHRCAAALLELRPSAASEIDVTVPTKSGRAKRSGIRVHRSRRLNSHEVSVCDGVPVTSVARTLLDLADVVTPQDLKRAIDEAEYRGKLDLAALIAIVEGNPGRRGGRVLALAQGPPALTRSEFEQRFLSFCRRHRLPTPAVGARIEGFEVDFVWPDASLVVETDGLAAHRTRHAMERDRVRDRRLLLAGYRTVRLTVRALRDEPKVVAADLRALLSGARAGAGGAQAVAPGARAGAGGAQAGTSSARMAATRSRRSSKPPSRSSTSSANAR
jgi:very-short-patch-repair endonuclease